MRRGTLNGGQREQRPPKPQPNNKRRIESDKFRRTRAERERAIFQYILTYTVEHMGHTPTLRQIADATDIPATSMVRKLLLALVEQDKLRFLDGLLIIPGSRFTWYEHTDDGPEYSGPSVPAQHWTVDDPADGEAGLHSAGRDRLLLPGSEAPGRLDQGT